MGLLSARGSVKEMRHNLGFPGRICKSKDEEHGFYKILLKNTNYIQRKENQTSIGLLFSIMKLNKSEEVFQSFQ